MIRGTKVKCRRCNVQDGHNAQSCHNPDEFGMRRIIVPRTTSQRAAAMAKAERISLALAAARFGISRQAVCQAWRQLYGNDDPPTAGRIPRKAKDRTDGLNVLRHGGTYAEAASVLGIAESTMRCAANRAGVYSMARRDNSRRDGRNARAAALVLERGFTIAQACTIERASQSSVRLEVAKRQRPAADSAVSTA